MTTTQELAQPTLALAAEVLDDTERTRIGNENRLRQLTRDVPDKDGGERGFGLDESHPDVARLAALVEKLKEVENDAIRNLQKVLQQNPLHPWLAAQKGVGDKQAARLLACIGDPYWNALHERPRTVGELWAFCGLHVANGVAVRRAKGTQANWSTKAKTRTFLITESVVKQLKAATCKHDFGVKHEDGCECSAWRIVYDERKAHTVLNVHAAACVRCGPSGKPAQPGSAWSDGHKHADALRVTGKELLKGLWLEARRLHLEA